MHGHLNACTNNRIHRCHSTQTPGFERGKLLIRLAELIEEHADELAAIETLDNGKTYKDSRSFDIVESAAVFRYYGGWADKVEGKTIEVSSISLLGSLLTIERSTRISLPIRFTSPLEVRYLTGSAVFY